MDGTPDKTLLELVAAGDKSAMRALYDRYAPGMRRFAENWLADKNDAADIVHEAMLDIWRNAGKFAGRSSVKSWMYTITRNKAVDRNRRSKRVVLDEPPVELEDDSPGPEAVIGAFQDAKAVRACIDKLSPTHRSAVLLAFFEGLTYQEIADIEGRPVGTIKTRIMHAKTLLMHCLTSSGLDDTRR
ncbi:MAG: sigma-70 family RNA polymerase sigma factor [Pseudomonadota bacterium]